MKPTYEIIITPLGSNVINAWYEDGRMLSIPTDPYNSDYQEYLNQASQSILDVTEQ